MIISKRLKFISSLVTDVDTIIDVGTDHGYVIIDLLKNNSIKYAIASDINKGPVERARENLKAHNLSSKAECRQGSGLKTIRPGEVAAAVIAGMGGNLIRDIIKADMDVFKSLEYAIVQPAQNPEVLREYLYKEGIAIEDEWIIYDEEKYYEIFKISNKGRVTKVDPIYYEVSEILLRKKDKVYKEYLDFKIDKYKRVIENLGDETENSRVRKQQLLEKIGTIKALLEEEGL